MDLHRILLKGKQKDDMNPFISQTYSAEFIQIPMQFGQGPMSHSFNKSFGNMPFKSFSYPNSTNLKMASDARISNATPFFNFNQIHENRSTMNLTSIVKSFNWKHLIGNDPYLMLNEIMSKSVEIAGMMGCHRSDASTEIPCNKESPKVEKNMKDLPASTSKKSYAEVTKMNLSNDKNNCNFFKPTANTVNLSSQKVNGTPFCKKECNVISPPQSYKTVNKNHPKNNRFGTSNHTRVNKDCGKPKFHPLIKNLNTRKPQNKRTHFSLKRELGTKRNNQKVDFDGSMWGQENTEAERYEDQVMCSPSIPSFIMRVRSISSESDCSADTSECLKNPRVRSISECSINSVDSEDSFIVFDDCPDDKIEESCEEESSSEDSDEESSLHFDCSGVPQVAFLKCIIPQWDTLLSKQRSDIRLPETCKNDSSHSSCAADKKVRFACGEALAKVRLLCVWDYAHRAARIGPWEQAARDRDRFAKRIASLAPTLNPVLDPIHRSKIYEMRFAPR